jgi:hypothetical protein
MPAGSETLIAGQYTVTYNGTSCGIMEGDAGVPTIEATNHAEPVNNTDAYGKSMIDAIYQGGDHFASFQCMEYKAGSIAAFWPFGALGVMGVIARLYYDMSSALVLTAVAGTPAANSPATLTASKSIIAPGFNGRLLYGPTLRKVPIRLALLPFSSTGNKWFTST